MPSDTIVRLRGRGLPLPGDNIDTDRIIPARFLRAVTFEGLEAHLFEDDRAETGGHPLDRAEHDGASILVVNANFGCGSSREHAPQAIRRRGFRAIVGESFSEIFFGNSVALGMPCVSAAPGAVAALMAAIAADPGTELTIDLETLTVAYGAAVHDVTVPAAARDSFLAGTWDATALLLDRFDEVEAVARRLPYIGGW